MKRQEYQVLESLIGQHKDWVMWAVFWLKLATLWWWNCRHLGMEYWGRGEAPAWAQVRDARCVGQGGMCSDYQEGKEQNQLINQVWGIQPKEKPRGIHEQGKRSYYQLIHEWRLCGEIRSSLIHIVSAKGVNKLAIQVWNLAMSAFREILSFLHTKGRSLGRKEKWPRMSQQATSLLMRWRKTSKGDGERRGLRSFFFP